MQIFVYWAFFGTKHKNIYAATTIWCLWKKKFLWSNGNFLLYSHFEILLKKVRNVSWVLRETKGLKIGCRQWFVILLIPNSGVGLGDKIHQTLKSQIKKNHSTSQKKSHLAEKISRLKGRKREKIINWLYKMKISSKKDLNNFVINPFENYSIILNEFDNTQFNLGGIFMVYNKVLSFCHANNFFLLNFFIQEVFDRLFLYFENRSFFFSFFCV